jgi:hypothetical protein
MLQIYHQLLFIGKINKILVIRKIIKIIKIFNSFDISILFMYNLLFSPIYFEIEIISFLQLLLPLTFFYVYWYSKQIILLHYPHCYYCY